MKVGKAGFVAVLGAIVALLAACSNTTGVEAQDPWARITGESGAVYFTLKNNSTDDVTFQGVTIDPSIATSAELHQSSADEDGMMAMQETGSVVIPAGKSIEFKPGGYHVMLMGVERAFAPGETISMRLLFTNADAINVSAKVRE